MKAYSNKPTYRAPFRREYVPTLPPYPRQVDAEDLPSIGWFRIVEQGVENTYIETADGSTVYVKIHH